MKEKLEIIKYLQQEIERQKEIIRQLDIKNLELTNIINELETTLRDLIFKSNNLNHVLTAQIILMRLKELKGDVKENEN